LSRLKKKKTILWLFQAKFAANCFTAAALVFLTCRCSACVFDLPLQRLCFLALQRSGKALQRKNARSAEARSAEDFKVCSAALQREARSAIL
jgi:ketopantoate reductase